MGAGNALSATQPPAPVTVQRTEEFTVEDVKGKGYRTDLCDCCAQPGGLRLCCYGYWCAPCLFGQNVEGLGPARWLGDKDEPFIIPCWAATLAFGAGQFLPMDSQKLAGLAFMPSVLQMLYRRRIRKQYSIEGHSDCCSCGDGCPGCCCKCDGDDCADCCSSFWCLPCSLCQDAREIAIRGSTSAPTLPAAVLTAPQSQDMVHLAKPVKATDNETT